jgi:intergrase/recombinase
MRPRRDHETARLIDASIDVQQSHGSYVAARLLCERGVLLETAHRVLHQPDQRRTYGKAVLH